ncbi:hypothetical protein [Nostoc sp. NZL]|uniref:hypothetical protein n=1 Tax=Nostoc sp. NZL TaxID=2650612 RepID=UPI001E5772E2|nr:hypothetical protein [Nostoc sp. NZL]
MNFSSRQREVWQNNVAWLMWLGVHLVYLPGDRSRFLVLLTWLHTYLFSDHSVRLILSVKKR